MKTFVRHQSPGGFLFPRQAKSAVWLGLALALSAVRAHANVATQTPGTPAVTNATASGIKIPASVFVTPRSPTEGRDPFFPRSMRPYTTPVVVAPVSLTNAPVVAVVVELRLGGISGTPEHRLAIINNHTFEVGEEAEVNTGTGRVRLRCIEIRADAVGVIVNGERREVRFRPGM